MLVLTDVIARETHLSLPTTASCGPRHGMRLAACSLAHMRVACMVLDGKPRGPGPKTVAMMIKKMLYNGSSSNEAKGNRV